MDLEKEFQAAAEQVNNLPDATAAEHMTVLYGLFKQATDGDVNMDTDEVDADGADKASGPAGLSQAQWESWNQFKGMPEEEAKRQYVAKVNEIAGPQGTASSAGELAKPQPAMNEDIENTSTAEQPASGPGVSQGGLRGDITAGAPYGGEDLLKGAQEGI
jgi:acyl-CoA-binding protein